MLNDKFHYWLMAARPKTLSISLAPIVMAASLAYSSQGQINGLILSCILIATLAIQVATNLFNDAADFERGADTPERLGPERVTAKGYLSSREVKLAAHLNFALAFIAGIYLAYQGGWPIITLGIASIISGYAYTGGPKPIAYSPLGEVFVIAFFGLAATLGSFYLLTGTTNLLVTSLGIALGFFAAGILLVNNYRDLDNDIKANKITLVYYLGRSKAIVLFAAFLCLPYLLVLYLYWQQAIPLYSLLLTLPSLGFAIYIIKALSDSPINPSLNLILVKTAKLQLIFSLCFSLGMVLG